MKRLGPSCFPCFLLTVIAGSLGFGAYRVSAQEPAVIRLVSGAYLTVDGVTKGPAIARFDRPGRNPWRDEKGFRGPHEIESPTGQWNRMEVLCEGDKLAITVNGHKTLEGTNAAPHAGKIVL